MMMKLSVPLYVGIAIGGIPATGAQTVTVIRWGTVVVDAVVVTVIATVGVAVTVSAR